MKKRVLVPVDFSESSLEALHWLKSMPDLKKAQLVPIYVIEMGGDPSAGGMNAVDAHAKLLEIFRKAGLSSNDDKPLRTVTAYGAPAEEIIRAAAKEKVDLIVMGTHGRRGLRRWVLGSVAEEVVRCAPCPVLAARALDRAAGNERKSRLDPPSEIGRSAETVSEEARRF